MMVPAAPPTWYGLDEQPTDLATAEQLLADPEGRRVGYSQAHTPDGLQVEISTVFLAMDAAIGRSAEPVLYETAVLVDGEEHWEPVARYHHREQALRGHRYVARAVRGGTDVRSGPGEAV